MGRWRMERFDPCEGTRIWTALILLLLCSMFRAGRDGLLTLFRRAA